MAAVNDGLSKSHLPKVHIYSDTYKLKNVDLTSSVSQSMCQPLAQLGFSTGIAEAQST